MDRKNFRKWKDDNTVFPREVLVKTIDYLQHSIKVHSVIEPGRTLT